MIPGYSELQKSILGGKISPITLLHGDEPFFVDSLANLIENNALSPENRSFNQSVFFGKDLNIANLLSLAKSFPMMGGQQCIIIKDADLIPGFGKGDKKEDKEALKQFEMYAQAPQESTYLVLCFNKPVDERLVWVKAIQKKGVVFGAKKFYDDKLPGWVASYCHEKGKKISPKAIQLLVDFIGNDLKRIAAELEKLALNLRNGEEISAEVIEKYVGISKEYNVFELQKAIIRKDSLKVYTIANYFSKNLKDNPLPQVIFSIYNFFSKLLLVHGSTDKSDSALASLLGVNPYFVKDYTAATRYYNLTKTVDILHQVKWADLYSKGIESGSRSEKDILMDLMVRILR